MGNRNGGVSGDYFYQNGQNHQVSEDNDRNCGGNEHLGGFLEFMLGSLQNFFLVTVQILN